MQLYPVAPSNSQRLSRSRRGEKTYGSEMITLIFLLVVQPMILVSTHAINLVTQGYRSRGNSFYHQNWSPVPYKYQVLLHAFPRKSQGGRAAGEIDLRIPMKLIIITLYCI